MSDAGILVIVALHPDALDQALAARTNPRVPFVDVLDHVVDGIRLVFVVQVVVVVVKSAVPAIGVDDLGRSRECVLDPLGAQAQLPTLGVA